MSGEKYKFFTHKDCEYYPCHENAGDAFNCLFCYCPLYATGSACEGDFKYLDNGIKDCSACLVPHSEGAFDYIMERYHLISDLAKENR